MRSFAAFGALALVAGSHAGIAAPLPDAVPVEVFAALPAIDHPKLSPDGTKIAGKIGINGKQVLLVQPLFGDGKPSALAEGKIDINWWEWVNDNWLVVGVGDDDVLYDEDVYVTRIAGVSADMKTIKWVDPNRSGVDADNVIWYAEDGSPRVLLSKETGVQNETQWYPSVFDVDVSTGKAKLVVPSMDEVWDWEADASGTVRYGVIWHDDKKRGVVYRGPGGGRFERVMFGKREEDSIPEPAIYRADGSALAFDDGDGRDAVYEMSLPSFALGKKLLGDPRYDNP